MFIAFLGVAIWRANRPSGKHAHLSERRYDPLRWYLWVVLVACILILWRACFRLAEAITGESASRETYKRLIADDQVSSVDLLLEKTISDVSNSSQSSSASQSSPLYLLIDLSNTPERERLLSTKSGLARMARYIPLTRHRDHQ